MTGIFRCWGTRAVLDLFVDDRLDGPQAGRVAEHLAACSACRAEADALAPIPTLKSAAPPVPAGLTASILKAYEEGLAEKTVGEGFGWRPSPAFAAAAAAAALLLVSQAVPGPTTLGPVRPVEGER